MQRIFFVKILSFSKDNIYSHVYSNEIKMLVLCFGIILKNIKVKKYQVISNFYVLLAQGAIKPEFYPIFLSNTYKCK